MKVGWILGQNSYELQRPTEQEPLVKMKQLERFACDSMINRID